MPDASVSKFTSIIVLTFYLVLLFLIIRLVRPFKSPFWIRHLFKIFFIIIGILLTAISSFVFFYSAIKGETKGIWGGAISLVIFGIIFLSFAGNLFLFLLNTIFSGKDGKDDND